MDTDIKKLLIDIKKLLILSLISKGVKSKDIASTLDVDAAIITRLVHSSKLKITKNE